MGGITERALLEASLRFLTPLFVVLDPTGRPFLMSDKLQRLLKLESPEDLPAFPEALKLSPDSNECELSKIARGVAWSGNAALVAERGEVLAVSSIECHPLFDDHDGLIAFLVFIEENAGVQDRIRQKNQKLDLLGSIAGGVAHDLNNILTGILGHLSYLRMTGHPEQDQLDSLNAIEDGARKAAGLTGQILDFARGESAEPRSVDVRSVVISGINLLRGALPRNVTLNVQDDGAMCSVLGDESQLAQIFMNLTINAAEALPHGGVIDVSLRTLSVLGDPDLPNGDYVRLQIRDNGIGMSPDVQERIFQPFFTTKKKHGTGLGLANVFSLVRVHRGLIRVQSELGRGSLFEVYLPVATISASPGEVPNPEPLSGKARILVIEDEEIVRTVIQKSLEHLGYDVQVAETGSDAIEMYSARPDRFDLVILDMMMPQMSGDEVFLRLKKFNPDVAVLIASGYTSDVRARNVLERGGLGFIQKPFAVEELAREVQRCLERAKQRISI